MKSSIVEKLWKVARLVGLSLQKCHAVEPSKSSVNNSHQCWSHFSDTVLALLRGPSHSSQQPSETFYYYFHFVREKTEAQDSVTETVSDRARIWAQDRNHYVAFLSIVSQGSWCQFSACSYLCFVMVNKEHWLSMGGLLSFVFGPGTERPPL